MAVVSPAPSGSPPHIPRSAGARWAGRALGLLFGLALAEGLLRVAFGLYAHRAQANCGLRPELLARLLYAYSHPRPSPGPEGTDGVIHDPHRGWRHAPDLRDRELHGARMSTNHRGMRGARDYAPHPPPGMIRIAAVGDSFTFGEGVADGDTWPAQLEHALPGTEVMNLGERAYAHDQMYFALRDDGIPLAPDAVILGFYANDLWRDELTFYCAEKPRLSPVSSTAAWRTDNVPVPPPWEAWDRERRLPLVYAVPRILLESLVQPALTDQSGEVRATESLRRMRQLAESAGARFVLVNLPDHPDRPAETRSFFARYCTRTGAECVDAGALFAPMAGTTDPAALRARYQRPNDIHYSREGYAVVTEALRRHFAQRPLTPAHPSLHTP